MWKTGKVEKTPTSGLRPPRFFRPRSDTPHAERARPASHLPAFLPVFQFSTSNPPMWKAGKLGNHGRINAEVSSAPALLSSSCSPAFHIQSSNVESGKAGKPWPHQRRGLIRSRPPVFFLFSSFPHPNPPMWKAGKLETMAASTPRPHPLPPSCFLPVFQFSTSKLPNVESGEIGNKWEVARHSTALGERRHRCCLPALAGFTRLPMHGAWPPAPWEGATGDSMRIFTPRNRIAPRAPQARRERKPHVRGEDLPHSPGAAGPPSSGGGPGGWRSGSSPSRRAASPSTRRRLRSSILARIRARCAS